jgi:hypothetical protein
MDGIHFLDLFQGIATLVAAEPKIMFGRIFLMLLGFVLIYLGSRNILEPLLMVPMGLGMSSVNAGVMFLEGNKARHPVRRSPAVGPGRTGERAADQLAAADLYPDLQQRPDRLPGVHGHRRPARRRLCHGASLPEHFHRPLRRTGNHCGLPDRRRPRLTEREAAAVATIGGADGRWCCSPR